MSFSELADTLAPTEDDRLLQAEALVRSYCGWHIAPSRTDTYTPDGRGPTVVLLPSLYVTAVSVTLNAVPLVEDTEYVRFGLGLSLNYWGEDALVITFDHGYDEPPADVTAVVQAIASRAVDNPRSLVSRTIGPFSEAYGQASGQSTALSLLDAERAILAPYRIVKVM